MNRLKVVFFDLDNTLWDHLLAQKSAIEKVAEKYGLPPYEFNLVYSEFNEQAWLMYSRGHISLADMRLYRFALAFEALGEIAAGLDAQAIANEYLDIYSAEEGHLRPNADLVVKELARTYKLGILTNGFREIQLKKLDALSLGEYFTYLVSADETGCLKPSQHFFQFALQQTGVDADEIIFIGDSWEEDVLGGKRAGFKVVWYNPQKRPPPEPHLGMLPDYTINDLLELLPLVNGTGGK